MPIEYDLPVPENLRCLKVKLPILLAEAESQVVVDSVTQTPELTKKIDHIDVMVMGFEADPVFIHQDESHWSLSFNKRWPDYCCHRPGRAFIKKIIVRGVLHKQVYYVNQNDDVKHFGEDIPFTKMLRLREPEPVMDVDNVTVEFRRAKVDITWDLIRGCRLQQVGVIGIRVKVMEERNMYIQVCPPRHGCTRENLLRDPGFEQWVGDLPLGWGGINVGRTSNSVRTGSFGAVLGADPTRQAAIFQQVRRVRHHHFRDWDRPFNSFEDDYDRPGDSHHHRPDDWGGGGGHWERPHAYRMCFWGRRSAPEGARNCNFTLTASVVYYGEDGEILANLQNQWNSSSISTGWNQLCFDAGPPPEEIAYAQVFIAFRPEDPQNPCAVVIDDASLICVP
ncbi:MAG: DUF3794 domain-containing protein [Clostridia bacterium]|nr:DUF3794 domain-containing protein [Clostridia bacterium]